MELTLCLNDTTTLNFFTDCYNCKSDSKYTSLKEGILYSLYISTNLITCIYFLRYQTRYYFYLLFEFMTSFFSYNEIDLKLNIMNYLSLECTFTRASFIINTHMYFYIETVLSTYLLFLFISITVYYAIHKIFEIQRRR